jgi:glutamate synthase domain-containing protein 3
MPEGDDGKNFCCEVQDHSLEKALDHELLKMVEPALKDKCKVKKEIHLRNINRTVGTILSSEITRLHGSKGLPQDTIYFKATGSAGQSFAAFAVPGVTFEIEGDANDYFGKGLCGARLILYPPKVSTFVSDENVIVGNVAFYGATAGEAYIRGLAGERFCVRNSGVHVVVDAIGDHGCEYMTGGRVVILGEVGRNFAAGMSGGIAYIFDDHSSLVKRINPGLVDFDLLETEEEIVELKQKIQKHLDFTGSFNAKRILESWETSYKKFIKVMPRDYKRVLIARGELLV